MRRRHRSTATSRKGSSPIPTRAPSPSISPRPTPTSSTSSRCRWPTRCRRAHRSRRDCRYRPPARTRSPVSTPERGRDPARAEPTLPPLVGRRAAGRLPRPDRREVRVHGRERGACRRARQRPTSPETVSTSPGRPQLTSLLRTRYSSRLYHPPPAARHDGRLAEHEAAAVRRPPGPAGTQLRGRPQPSGRARGRPGRGASGLPAAARRTPTATGATAPYTLDPNARGNLQRARPGQGAATRRGLRHEGTTGHRLVLRHVRIGLLNGIYFVSVLTKLGYKAQLKLVPHNRSTWRVDRQAGVGGWGEFFPSANDFFSPEFTCRSYDPAHPNTNQNTARFCNRRIDAEITRARTLQTTDPLTAAQTLEHNRPRDHQSGARRRDPLVARARPPLPPGRQLHRLLPLELHRLDRRLPRPALGALVAAERNARAPPRPSPSTDTTAGRETPASAARAGRLAARQPTN